MVTLPPVAGSTDGKGDQSAFEVPSNQPNFLIGNRFHTSQRSDHQFAQTNLNQDSG